MTFTFPLHAVLPDGRQLIIDYMTTTELSEMFRMITEAARTGNGFGEDEYRDEDHFRTDVRQADKFVFKDTGTEKVIAWLTLCPSGICRSNSIRDPIFVVADWERGKLLSSFCGKFTIAYCITRGYDGILCDVFKNNIATIKTLQRLGFRKAGHVSVSGKVKDHGRVGTDFYFMDLTMRDNQMDLCFTKEGLYSPIFKVQAKL